MAASTAGAAWEDVTSQFKSAATQLGTSGFIMDEGFTLRDCMNALELGDPKMDSGMGSEAAKITAADELSSGKLSLDITNDELIGVSDTLLRLQVCARMIERLFVLADGVTIFRNPHLTVHGTTCRHPGWTATLFCKQF